MTPTMNAEIAIVTLLNLKTIIKIGEIIIILDK